MRTLSHLIGATVVVVLTGCGGSGSGGSSGPSAATLTQGTISGFGSVIINGTHYYTTDTMFTVDDQPGSQADLDAGQAVTVSSVTDSQGNFQAQTLEYDSTLVGPISAINTTNNSFTALGQTINVGVATVYRNVAGFQALAVGNVVKVSGLRDSSGNIAAGFVGVPSPAPTTVRLSGPVAALDTTAMTFTIGGETISYGGGSPATIVPSTATLQNGETVVAIGALDATGAIIAASKVKVRPALGGSTSGQKAEIEGLVTQAAQSGSFTIGSVKVDFDASTRFDGGTSGDLVVGNRVEAHGTVNSDGSLQASRIDIESTGGEAPVRGELVGALTAAPNTSATPNTLSLLGTTVNLSSSTVYVDDANPGNQAFGLASLQSGNVVAISVQITPATTSGGAPTLTALKVSLPRQSPPLDVASGPFSDVVAGSMTLSVADVGVTGQADCGTAMPTGSCTVYLVHGVQVTEAGYFAALALAPNANGVVMAFGSYSGAAGSTLVAQYLDLQTHNDSGDDGNGRH